MQADAGTHPSTLHPAVLPLPVRPPARQPACLPTRLCLPSSSSLLCNQEDPTLRTMISELYFEMHYHHPDMVSWPSGMHSSWGAAAAGACTRPSLRSPDADPSSC